MKVNDYIRFNRLFDLYGELLTTKQHNIVELHILEDLSLFEIAEQLGITRQAAGDAIATAKAKLEEFERKLHILERIDSTDLIIEKLKETVTDESQIQLLNQLYTIWKQ